MKRHLLVIGWYDHSNIGDEAFKVAFRSLFPEWIFSFFDQVPVDWKNYDAMIVGGGSFLDHKIPGLNDVTIPTAYVGVGLESSTHPYNVEAIKKARIVVARHENSYGPHAPDLVFINDLKKYDCHKNQITVLLNNHFSPHPNCEEWKLRAWDWFAVEMAQALDRLIIKSKQTLHFYPMCVNQSVDDRRSAAYIIDRMTKKRFAIFHCLEPSERDLVRLISKSNLVISHRFHGMVYSALLNTPFIGINSHQKMSILAKELDWEAMCPYYGFTVGSFLKAVDQSREIYKVKNYCEKAKETWRDMSALIERALFG